MAYTQARVDAALDAANSGATHAQLHTDDPGGSGTSNVGAQVDGRASITGLSGASAGADAGTGTFTILDPGDGAYTHVSLWTAATDGTFIGSGALTPEETFAGPGSLEVTITTTASST